LELLGEEHPVAGALSIKLTSDNDMGWKFGLSNIQSLGRGALSEYQRIVWAGCSMMRFLKR
jgi:hypothetical protein